MEIHVVFGEWCVRHLSPFLKVKARTDPFSTYHKNQWISYIIREEYADNFTALERKRICRIIWSLDGCKHDNISVKIQFRHAINM